MIVKLSAVLIAIVLVFGGAAATASAAQASLPTDALYPVKTLGESVSLGLSVNSAAKLEKALEHAQRRVDEIAALAGMAVSVPERVGDDYIERVDYALRLAARMSDEAMPQALEKIQQSLQSQLAALGQVRAARPDDAQLASVEWQLRQHIDLVALGLGSPQIFREQLAVMLQGSKGPSSTQEPSVTVTPDTGDDNSNDGNTNDSNTNDGVNGNDDDANGNDSNTNDDDANANDSNTNDDDANGNDDNGNINDDDGNTNDDDGNTNDDDGNTNDDDDSNGNGDDDSNGNDDDGNTNDDDDSNGNGDDDSNGNGDDDSNGNGDDSGGRGSSFSLNSLLIMVAPMGGFPLTD